MPVQFFQMQMRFHALALPHTVTAPEYSACAFTQKVLKFCKMMTERGHTVYHYGHERSQVVCTEHITVMDDATLKEAYGDYDWRSTQFKHSVDDHANKAFIERAVPAVGLKKQAGDFLLLFWSSGHVPIAAAHRDLVPVEPGIGCYNPLVAPFAVFESYAVMHGVYAKHSVVPRFMDAVVPNYFDAADFYDASEPALVDAVSKSLVTEASKAEASEALKTIARLPYGKYVVAIGRIIDVKGFQIAYDTCRLTGHKLVLAGQGDPKSIFGPSFVSAPPEDSLGCTFLGYVEPHERAFLLAGATALMCPTMYVEPFGGVNVEAQMSGIPVISTDWGAFAETVVHGVTGYRCRALEHFVWALRNVATLDRKRIVKWAHSNYGFTKIAAMYEEYFSMLSTVHAGKGFYAERPGRLALTWLEKV